MQFFLGTHMPSWLRRVDVPLFVSHRRLNRKRVYEPAVCSWALDSGGFTELSMFGEWRTTPGTYVTAVKRYQDELGSLLWAAPMDWMCEPFITEKTKKTVAEHQRLTVSNFLDLRSRSEVFIPVLQGWTLDDYLRCVDLYDQAGVDLAQERVVGVGSVCRRQSTDEAARIFHTLADLGLRLHGFGVKTDGLHRYGYRLASADSLAWSFNARRQPPMPGHDHKSCANCLTFALQWRERMLNRIPMRLEAA